MYVSFVHTSHAPLSGQVWNCELDSHLNYLRGHLKAVTGMATHHSWCPSVISCSLDKTIKMWNLENMMEVGKDIIIIGLSSISLVVRAALFTKKNV